MIFKIIRIFGIMVISTSFCQQSVQDFTCFKEYKTYQKLDHNYEYIMRLSSNRFFWQEHREGPFYFVTGDYEINKNGELCLHIDTLNTFKIIEKLNKEHYPFRYIFGYTIKEYDFTLYEDTLKLNLYDYYKEDTVSLFLKKINLP